MSLLDEEFYEEDAKTRKEDGVLKHFMFWGIAVVLISILKFSEVRFSGLIFPIITGGFMGYLFFIVFNLKIRTWYFVLILMFCFVFTGYIIYSLFSDMDAFFGRELMFFYILGFALGYLVYRGRYRS